MDIQIVAVGNEVNSEHFGLNFVYDWEQFGDLGWQKFDEVVERSGATNLRFPGGVSAEQYFDIRDPDAQYRTDQYGEERPVTPLSEFLDYTNELGHPPTIIVPTSDKMTDDPYGQRDFDEGWEEDLKEFVEFALEQSLPTGIAAFEIGNEYPTYMTSNEYGKIASSMAEIISDTIDEFWLENDIPADVSKPEVLVEVWASTNGNLSQEDLVARNNGVIQEFDDEELAAVDGVVSHVYLQPGVREGLPNEHSADNVDVVLEYAMDIMDNWQDVTNQSLSYHLTEYNVNFKYEEYFGLKQAAPLLEMIENSILVGFDTMSIWSAQYHSISLADTNGNLQVAGHLYNHMTENLLGKSVLETTDNDERFVVSAYYDDGEIVLYIASISEQVEDFQMSLNGLQVDILDVSAMIMGIDEASADGIFMDQYTNLEPYQDPDAEVEWNDVSSSFNADSNVIDLVFEPYEVLVVTVTYEGNLNIAGNGDGVVTGTDAAETLNGSESDDLISGLGGDDILIAGAGDDVLIGGIGADVLDGGTGSDTADYSKAISGVSIDFGYTFTNSGEAAGDSFVSIENIVGTMFDDSITADANSNQVFGLDGDDLIYGRDGADWIEGGAGADSLNGGDGNDTIYGDDGLDMLAGGDGNDQLFGGKGNDTISGNAGGDAVDAGDGSDTVYGGSGNDDLYGGNGSDFILGDGGDDIINGGAGGDRLMGGAGADAFIFDEFGPGTFELILDYTIGEDTIHMHGPTSMEDFITMSLGSNLALVYHGGSLIFMLGVNGNELSEEDFVFF